MRNVSWACASLLLTFSCLARAQDVPQAPGRPVSPEDRALAAAAAPPLDAAIVYPPVKPEIRLRSEWLKAEWGCRHLSASDLGDQDIDDDPQARVRVAVHHTETFVTNGEKAMTAERSAADVRTLLCGIRNYHMSSGNSDGTPWSDIGYHYLIDWKGRVWQGRKVEKQGANVSGMNPGTIGVALMGDFERQRPTAAQLAALEKTLAYLVFTYKISPMAIHGHHEYMATQCPGRYLERKNEYLEPYVEARASPLRRLRMALIGLWGRMRADRMVAEETPTVLLDPVWRGMAPADASAVHVALPPSAIGLPSFDGAR